MSDQKNINNIISYSYNLSSEEERIKLEKQIETNIKFREEANIYFDLIKGFKAMELESFNRNLYNWEKKHKKTNPIISKTIKLNSFIKYAAAAILLLTFLPLGYNYISAPLTSAELFEENFTAINYSKNNDVLIITRTYSLYNSGISLYKSKKYALAAENFKTFLLRKDLDVFRKQKAQLYLATAYIKMDKTSDAKILLNEIISKGMNPIRQEAEWYLVLSLLKENNIVKAQKNLEKIYGQKKPHLYKDKALKLKQQFDKI
jgi:FimV-like protein